MMKPYIKQHLYWTIGLTTVCTLAFVFLNCEPRAATMFIGPALMIANQFYFRADDKRQDAHYKYIEDLHDQVYAAAQRAEEARAAIKLAE